MGNISLLAAFIAGIISFISPCVLPLIPMYISFISGLSLEEMKNGIGNKRILRRVAIGSLLFILGFSIVFIVMGASATFLGRFLLAKLSILRKISGFIIIIFGLHITGVFRLGFLNYEKRFHFRHRPARFLGPFLVGLAFAFGWTPCIGPVLSAILIYSGSQETVWQGISLLSMYSLGLGVPFFLAGIGANTFLSFLKKIRKYYRVVEIVTGIFLMIMGVLLIMDFLTVLNDYLVKWFPWLIRG